MGQIKIFLFNNSKSATYYLKLDCFLDLHYYGYRW